MHFSHGSLPRSAILLFTGHAATMQNFFSIGSVSQRCEELCLPDTAGLVDGFSANSVTPAQAAYFTFKVLIFCTDTNEVLLLLLSPPQEHYAALK